MQYCGYVYPTLGKHIQCLYLMFNFKHRISLLLDGKRRSLVKIMVPMATLWARIYLIDEDENDEKGSSTQKGPLGKLKERLCLLSSG